VYKSSLSLLSKYFEFLVRDCPFVKSVSCISSWSIEVREYLREVAHKKVFFYITDVDNRDETLNLEFARSIRSLQDEFSNLYAIFIGRKS